MKNESALKKRKGIEIKTFIPDEFGYAVSMTQFRGTIYVACQRAVFRLSKDGRTLLPLKFKTD